MFYFSKGNPLLIRKNILSSTKNYFILDNINLSLKKDSIIVIRGQNGSGKTTLINNLKKKLNNFFFKQNNILWLVFFLNKINNFNINIKKYNKLLLIQKNIKKLSLGFLKYFNTLINQLIIKNILIQDEPFNGLDPRFIKIIIKNQKNHKLVGGKILFSYHNIYPLKRIGTVFLK